MTDAALVTGFPRLIARRVATDLLTRGAPAVVLLVGAGHRDEAQRWRDALPLAEAARVTICEGDVTAIDLGLAGAEYLDLARRVGEVHHTALALSDADDPREAEALNTRGNREVLEFARTGLAAGAAPRVMVYGSVRVAGDFNGTLHEDDLELAQGFRSPWEASLLRVERLWRRAAREVPVTVLRAALTVGDSKTGEFDRIEGLYVLVLVLLGAPVELRAPLPFALVGDRPLNVVPVDFVARAGVALAVAPEAVGRTLHLVDPTPLPARRLWELLARAAARQSGRGLVPVHVARALLTAPGRERLTRSPRAFVDQVVPRARYGSAGARSLLGLRGVECPPFADYVDGLVDAVRARLGAAPARVGATEADADDALW